MMLGKYSAKKSIFSILDYSLKICENEVTGVQKGKI